MLRALLLAPPGAGKGTQGDRLAEIYGVPHIATGDLLRENVTQRTEVGQRAKALIDKGEPVPDDLVLSLVLERISRPEPLGGFVLDGFPRTLTQARTAYEWGTANHRTFGAVVNIEVPTDELVARLLARGETEGRSDDTLETIRHRLAVYSESTKPLLEFYRQREILFDVDGTGSVDEVSNRIRRHLDVLDYRQG